jgi:2-polyprenyl-3-methyl-5-hydroxy-6-metoxy-1,4-benzoquinol methylase
MKPIDRLLQSWRISKALPFISNGDRVLDIGCADGAMLRCLIDVISEGVGVDPELSKANTEQNLSFIPGVFPGCLPDERPFDCIMMLAVLEHIPPKAQSELSSHCARFLNPGGKVIITVPSALVDPILSTLRFLHLIDGMSLQEHYGFKPSQTPALFTPHGFKLLQFERFQFGLNNLFVFQKPNLDSNYQGID